MLSVLGGLVITTVVSQKMNLRLRGIQCLPWLVHGGAGIDRAAHVQSPGSFAKHRAFNGSQCATDTLKFCGLRNPLLE